MHADSYFTIGREHLNKGLPCQDYADAASLRGGSAYAVVSDGCSTGGKTDVGSRVLTLSTAQAIRQHWQTTKSPLAADAVNRIKIQQRVVASAACAVLGCSNRDMLATSIAIYLSPDGGFAHIQGDGVVAWSHNGRIGMTRYDWGGDKNAPLYPAYAEDDYQGFIAFYGGDISAPVLQAQTWEQPAPGEELVLVKTVDHTLGEGVYGPVIQIPNDVRFVAAFTDGITQIDNWEWKDAVVQLMDFPTHKGAFAKRQMIWLVDESHKVGRGPLDDLAWAVIDAQGKETP